MDLMNTCWLTLRAPWRGRTTSHNVPVFPFRYRLHIIGEVSLGINHCLCALPGTKKEDITRVMSHPQALAQCDGYIRSLGCTKEAVDDTAGAAQMVRIHIFIDLFEG